MADYNDVLERFIAKLTKKGWIEKSWFKRLENGRQIMITWTPLGIEKMRNVYPVMHELGFDYGYIGGELESFLDLLRMCIKENGPE